MKILVAGKSGQFGSKLVELLCRESRFKVVATDRSALDVTRKSQVDAAIEASRPDWIVNATAYNDVERAESEPEKAQLVNDVAVGYLADAAQTVGARLLHLSTDYVFSGDFGSEPRRPYTEEDLPSPLSCYGASKRLGELRLAAHPAHSVVLRTSWLYGGPGKNFLHTILRVGEEARKEGRAVRVVHDQIGTPTDCWSLAAQVRAVLDTDLRGVFHASSHGEGSWYDFARAIFQRAALEVPVEPIRMRDYPTRARRPPYSVLENRRLGAMGLDVMPHWYEGLERAWGFIAASVAAPGRQS